MSLNVAALITRSGSSFNGTRSSRRFDNFALEIQTRTNTSSREMAEPLFEGYASLVNRSKKFTMLYTRTTIDG